MTRSIAISLKLLPLLLALSALAACGSGSGANVEQAAHAATQQPDTRSLPEISTLDQLAAGLTRSASSDRLNLLETSALATSPAGASQLPGFLGLDIAVGKPAWALFAAAGLDAAGEIVPSGLTTVFNKPFYLGFANFSTGRWQWQKRSNIGTLPLQNGAELISPTGKVYVIALAWEQKTDISQLELLFSAEIPASPAVQIALPQNTAADPAEIVSGYELVYSAAGSTPGSGAVITGVYYDFGDSTGTVIGTDPEAAVPHIYASAGNYTLTVRVDNDLGYSDTDTRPLVVSTGNTELLVVCNADMPDSLELADYYMSPLSGRGIAQDHRLELPLGMAVGPSIDRASYESGIRDPIRAFITDNNLTNSLKYILLLDGIPHQIPGTNGGDIDLSSNTAVDSELCTLFSDGSYAHESFLWNEDAYQNFQQAGHRARSFYAGLGGLGADYSFEHGSYDVTDSGNVKYPLDYLVGRLDAYDLADARALVDRSLAADTSGNGWVVFDTSAGRVQYDTMTDPVWPLANNTGSSGEELMFAAPYNYFIDVTDTRIIGQPSDNMPAGSVDNVICYAGWGVNHTGGSWPSGPEYILDDLLFTYLPGAAWISYESFNGTDFDSATVDGDRSDINRAGQGQICDFLHRGGSCAIGHVYEPWTIAVGDERAVFCRYAVKGDRWIEAAYKGLRCLSWMDVVVGDPLCTVK